MEPPLRSLSASPEAAMSGNPSGGGDGASGPADSAEAFANHFSRGQIAEMMARLEDARLAMEADQPPARPAPNFGAQRLWLALGRAASPQRGLEYRALRATVWSDFTQEEINAMGGLMKQSLTRRLARYEQDSAKAKARAEAEAIAREQARKKKAEHDAKVAQAAMEAVKRRPLRSGRRPLTLSSNRSS